ncbi:MAG: 16S rRNA (adenine(1518)-N(6)/adenine(1519)-N(6))-dimethyltransferase RsmA [Candidatus Sumerlaeaceae bacterium]|nr:16S rRNA (adenine(1518)-N(6)/adenine(1519)-N(6))-dimethyltransferase RsmA [Candidatus Sumerlaeaceae bacterium]
MSDLTERGEIQVLLRRHGLHLNKRLGQHFLADVDVLEAMADALDAGPGAQIVEIGAGLGNLTQFLALRGAAVTALELDPRFTPIHRELMLNRQPDEGPIEFQYLDALDFDYAAAMTMARAAGLRPLIAGNIPYQITSPLIMKILETGAEFERMALMMQKEVADRLAAAPGSKRNGGISIKAQYFCDIVTVCNVPAASFVPPPEVNSAIVAFGRKPPLLNETGRQRLFDIVDAAFAQRRKMLGNSIASQGIGLTKEQVDAALAKIGKPPTTRAEQLGLEEFVALLSALGTL